MKRIELVLKEETEKRKALETKVQNLEELDSVPHVAYTYSKKIVFPLFFCIIFFKYAAPTFGSSESTF